MKRVIHTVSTNNVVDLSTVTAAEFNDLACMGVFAFRTDRGTVRYLRCTSGSLSPDNEWGFGSLLSQSSGGCFGKHRMHIHREDGLSFSAKRAHEAVRNAVEKGRDVVYFDDAAEFCRWMADGFSS